MNKELIKKYKAEFDYWIDGGELMYLTSFSSTRVTATCVEDLFSNPTNHIKGIITNDEYAEFRKALCEGQAIQYNPNLSMHNRWDDITTISPSITDSIKNYRIKPDEPKFKVGDWVTHIDYKTTVGKIVEIFNVPNARECYVDWGCDKGSHWKNKLKLWEPETGEYCWFINGNKIILVKYMSMLEDGQHKGIDTQYFDTVYSDECQPFIGTLPTFTKD